ncbi:AAA family ATPase [Nocardioides lijunqiniae]|uniref:AAA family ATPase n=1 Tax=Nocardioides lijunqiniae TaxID=2760832 RepID=UPI0018789B11|nr:AAA family ATPase [Nocardioides lijunqiniae]
MIAFLGPNEAGKTTVLKALDWYSHGGALPATSVNKSNPPSDGTAVVSVDYWLEAEDLKALDGLELAQKPEFYLRSRTASGGQTGRLKPMVHRKATAFDKMKGRFVEAVSQEGDPPDEDESEPHLANWSATVLEALADPNAGWSQDWDTDFEAALSRLDGTGQEELGDDLRRTRVLLQSGTPDVAARAVLRERLPEFAMFTESDRDLQSSYELSDDAVRANPPKALANLAWVAELDLEDLWRAIQSDDARDARTKERRANERLSARLSSRWSQRELDVEFNVDGTRLEIQVFEKSDDGAVSPISERSDGLQTFVALVAFLARHDFTVPPVLLVDEAETHLHYDAQADLVEVLTRDISATQVFYTTHSPGCLPRDLGTGIRLVRPSVSRSDESKLRNDFWTSDSPGFSPLLFAMGAGAAAFSAFRKAVLTEGASDMILLPSLLRLATGESDLEFQVAPGIANYHGTGLELEEIAARVVYLVDGDKGGDDHRARLVGMGIPDERIKQFPQPTAVEDYVHPDRYLGLVNDLLAVAGNEEPIRLEELDRSVSIGKAVETWCEGRGIRSPGKTVIAAQLVDDPSTLVLADGAKPKLASLHGELMKALNRKST